MNNELEQNDNAGLDSLVKQISNVQDVLQSVAAHAINLSLTARNWLIGYYIVEYEQNGEDKAQYGANLLNTLSKRLNRSGMEPRRLREYRQFYLFYSFLGAEIVKYLRNNATFSLLADSNQKWRSPTAILQTIENEGNGILRLQTAKLKKWQTPPQLLFNRLSATHLIYLSNIKEDLKRAFYEQETIKGCWTVKELDRQVSSLYYERIGASKDRMALQQQVADHTIPLTPKDVIHDPVSLEFLELEKQDIFNRDQTGDSHSRPFATFFVRNGKGILF